VFDSIFDNIYILIPLAIVIVRVVIQARKKHEQKTNPKAASKPKPPPPRLHIPVHFEDDVEESGRGELIKAKERAGPLPQKKKPAPLFPEERKASSGPHSQGAKAAPVRESSPMPKAVPPAVRAANTGFSAPAQNNFPAGLKNLSPLKQAVVMAEVLGAPKSLQ